MRFRRVLGQFNTAALSASAGMDLCFDNNSSAAQFFSNGLCLFRSFRHFARRRRDAEIPEDRLCLIFVDLHVSSFNRYLNTRPDNAAACRKSRNCSTKNVVQKLSSSCNTSCNNRRFSRYGMNADLKLCMMISLISPRVKP